MIKWTLIISSELAGTQVTDEQCSQPQSLIQANARTEQSRFPLPAPWLLQNSPYWVSLILPAPASPGTALLWEAWERPWWRASDPPSSPSGCGSSREPGRPFSFHPFCWRAFETESVQRLRRKGLGWQVWLWMRQKHLVSVLRPGCNRLQCSASSLVFMSLLS